MFEYLRDWYRRVFADPRAVTFAIILAGAALLIWLMVRWLQPILASIVIAYLLDDLVARLVRKDTSRRVAVGVVYTGFIAASTIVVIEIVPILTSQSIGLIREIPSILHAMQSKLSRLSEMYPILLHPDRVQSLLQQAGAEFGQMGQELISNSVAALPRLIAVLVYLILVPLLVFFFLKDKDLIIGWMKKFLPSERSLAKGVWTEIDEQIGNYVRGKVMEILIVGVAAYVTFALFDLNYSVLLGVIVGFSVLIPYVGATLVTLPVIVVANLQFGFEPIFWWVVAAYLILQALDGNVLVPLLFSEVVNLHPVAIIAAVLFFGSLWGFWGVFFAIPLATTLRAIVVAWPKAKRAEPPAPEAA